MMMRRNHFAAILPSLMLGIMCFTACTKRSATDNNVSRSQQAKETARSSPATTHEKIQQINNVDAIQKVYAGVITNLEAGNLDSTAFKYDCHKERSGTVSYFTENGKLRLIVHRYSEYDHFSAVDRYFVQDSALFFAHTSSTSWVFESGPEGSTRDNIIEKRTYLVKEQPVKCLEKKYVIHSQVADNSRPDEVPNREVDCSDPGALKKKYQLLIRHRFNPGTGCLE